MKVAVLMSTYNGEKYLKEQIDSILTQTGVEVELLVRDDGSTDGTIAILEAYEAGHRLHRYGGPNLGPARSFMQLLADAPEADFYAFADQDDVWLPEKLATACEALKGVEAGRAAMYFCQTQLVDARLNPLPSVIIQPHLTFGESLVYEFVGGCTMVLNNPLRRLVAPFRPEYLAMHDVWIYSVCLAVGGYVSFDPTPRILYRQHGSNTIGQGYSFMHEMRRRWRRFAGGEHSRLRRAKEIARGFSSKLPAAEAELLTRFIKAAENPAERCRLLFDGRYRCANAATWRLFKLNVLLNTF